MNDQHKLMNSVALAAATGLGSWGISGVKKANKLFHAEKGEPLIFTGRYSTPAKILHWIETHPDFIARRVLAPRKSSAPASLLSPAVPAPRARPARRAA